MIQKAYLCLTFLGFVFSASAPATTFVVDTSTDTVANDGLLSLREAILSANSNPGKDVIVMSDTLEEGITLAGEALEISGDVEIDGTYSQPPVIGKSTEKQFVFTGPIQVIIAGQDRMAPRKATTELVAHLNNPEVHVIPKSGHMVPQEAANKCRQLLKTFIFANNPAT